MQKIQDFMQIEKLFDNNSININCYKFDQYKNYPSLIEGGWINLLKFQLENHCSSNEWSIYLNKYKNDFDLLGSRISEWDQEHFGFKLAILKNFYRSRNINNSAKYKETIFGIIEELKNQEVKFISVRINGDDLDSIHCFEEFGFKYYENIIWPVVELEKLKLNKNDVSFFDTSVDNFDEILNIANTNQYQRSHFHCDDLFDRDSVNSLYSKWAQTSLTIGKKIAIIKENNKIVGYFICEEDKTLSGFLGANYGRLQSLALDSAFRGKGLGKRLFEGTLYLLKSEGCNFVDSGYATKNHVSAKLHINNKFESVYEEITMHLWI